MKTVAPVSARRVESPRVTIPEGGISLVMLDLIMPVMDGFKFLAALRGQPAWRALPVLVMTSKDLTPEDRRRLPGCVEAILRKGQHSRDDVLEEVPALAGRYTRGAGQVAARADGH